MDGQPAKVTIFQKQKVACLAAVDLSRKGSIDEAIVELVNFINSQENYVTTSSCSGRISVFSYPSDTPVKKQGCNWLHITHGVCHLKEVLSALDNCTGDVFFKFESFVLHVQCATLEHAQKLLAEAVGAGYRNSGISVSNKGKIVVAVRSTHSLEVPLAHQGEILVGEDYIDYLVNLGNQRMKENIDRINRFFGNILVALPKLDIPKEDKGKRAKNKGQTNPNCKDTSGSKNSKDCNRSEGDTNFNDMAKKIKHSETENLNLDGELSLAGVFDCAEEFGALNIDSNQCDRNHIKDAAGQDVVGINSAVHTCSAISENLSEKVKREEVTDTKQLYNSCDREKSQCNKCETSGKVSKDDSESSSLHVRSETNIKSVHIESETKRNIESETNVNSVNVESDTNVNSVNIDDEDTSGEITANMKLTQGQKKRLRLKKKKEKEKLGAEGNANVEKCGSSVGEKYKKGKKKPQKDEEDVDEIIEKLFSEAVSDIKGKEIVTKCEQGVKEIGVETEDGVKIKTEESTEGAYALSKRQLKRLRQRNNSNKNGDGNCLVECVQNSVAFEEDCDKETLNSQKVLSKGQKKKKRLKDKKSDVVNGDVESNKGVTGVTRDEISEAVVSKNGIGENNGLVKGSGDSNCVIIPVKSETKDCINFGKGKMNKQCSFDENNVDLPSTLKGGSIKHDSKHKIVNAESGSCAENVTNGEQNINIDEILQNGITFDNRLMDGSLGTKPKTKAPKFKTPPVFKGITGVEVLQRNTAKTIKTSLQQQQNTTAAEDTRKFKETWEALKKRTVKISE